jgi:beta-lactamase superfamily II metal-dependent hydrolase
MSHRASSARFAGLALLLTLLALAGCAERNTSIYLPDTTAPVVSAMGENQGAVSWQTDEDCTCVLLYGKQQGIYDHYGYNVADGGHNHHADLIDVPADKYYFRVMATDRSGNAATSTETTFTLTALPEPGKFVYTMVNVGWGDCHFFELPNGTTVMIDAAQAIHALDVNTFLNAKHVVPPSGITYMIGTHAHADHLGSFPGIITLYNKAIFLAPESSSVSVWAYLAKPLADAHMEHHGLREGQTSADTDFLKWDEEDGVRVKVMSAGAGRFFSPGNPGDSINCDSAVLKISYGQVDFLVTADAEEFAEDRMVKFHSSDLPCEILKVAHHANDDATSNIFLNWVRPRVGLISNSLAENDGVFKQSVINLLRGHNADYYVTDRVYMNAARNAAPQYGHVTVTTDGETYVVSSWK